MKRFFCSDLSIPIWAVFFFPFAAALATGALIYGIDHRDVVSDVGHINTGGTAIANFGAVPVNPDWLQLTHKSGQAITDTPSPEWAVLTSAYEPHVERISGPNEWDRPTWKITFRP